MFIIIAVVIFGIFTLISYLLFQDSLTPKLTSIFEESFKNLEYKQYYNYFKEVSPLKNSDLTLLKDSQGYTITKKNVKDLDNRVGSFFYYQTVHEDIILGGKYQFQIDLFIKTSNISNKFTSISNVNLRIKTEHHEKISRTPLDYENNLGKWLTYKVDLTIPEELEDFNHFIQGSITIDGQEKIEFISKNARLNKIG